MSDPSRKRFKHRKRGFKNPIFRSKIKKRVKPMTICIAAISDANSQYPKIVFCADRLVSGWIQFEHGVPKIKPLKAGCFVMTSSNDSLMSDMLIENVKREIETKEISVREIVDIFSNECKKLLRKSMEQDVLFKYGLSYENFIENSKQLSQDMIRIIANELDNYNYIFESNFIILGIESEPHIYTINQNGDYKLNDFIGFASIGSGSPLAFSEMTKYAYHPNAPIDQAMIRVYASKKMAERAGGVGQNTDLFVLHVTDDKQSGKKIHAIWNVLENQEVKKTLEEGIKDMRQAEATSYHKVTEKLANYFKTEQGIEKTDGSNEEKK